MTESGANSQTPKQVIPPDALYWLALAKAPGIGYKSYLILLNHHDTPKAAFEAADGSWGDIEGIRGQPKVGDKRAECLNWAQLQLEKLTASRWNMSVFGDKNYPEGFTHLHNPPPFFFFRGGLAHDQCLGVVGSRQISDYGRRACTDICESVAAAGVCIVSGMAKGIDAAAHRAALGSGGQTIAVWGTGPDVVYPDDHDELGEEIAMHGALVTEYPFGTPPLAQNFPIRNRLIAALSQGVLVVQAAEKSGALITAHQALEQGKEVYAVPGEIGSRYATGSNALIQEGARLVTSADEILADFGLKTIGRPKVAGTGPKPIPPHLPPFEQQVLEALGESTCHIDRLATSLSSSVGEVSAALLSLELQGLIRQTAGKQFQRT